MIGDQGGNRTPTNGFGDHRTAIILPGHCLVEAVRFELTDPFEPLVFKTNAISQTLPHFLYCWSG